MYFVGIDNYLNLLQDVDFCGVIVNMVIFIVFFVGIELVFGFLIVLVFWCDDRFNCVCLMLIFIFVMIMLLVVGLIFKGLLFVDYGMVGYYFV